MGFMESENALCSGGLLREEGGGIRGLNLAVLADSRLESHRVSPDTRFGIWRRLARWQGALPPTKTYSQARRPRLAEVNNSRFEITEDPDFTDGFRGPGFGLAAGFW